MSVSINTATAGGGGGSSSSTTAVNIPAAGYRVALRASQPTNGNLIDQSSVGRVLNLNTGLFPVSWVASGAVTLNTYRTPVVLNGFIYKATVGGTNGATEPTWPTTVGATVVSGTVTYTCEKGPWYTDVSGYRLFRSLSTSQIGVAGNYVMPATTDQWDMNSGQSLIVHLRVKQNWDTSYPSAAADGAVIYGTRDLTGTNRGFNILAYGAAGNNALRFIVRGDSGVLSGIMSATSTKRQMDGNLRDIVFMVDGVLKTAYCFTDGVALGQSDMTGAEICPHGMNLVSILGSTAGAYRVVGGGINSISPTTTFECSYQAIDEVVLDGPLPANIQAIASWFSTRDALLPQSLVQ